jgi:type IV secretory pathway TraG/TraD family ATPase VirD4
MGFYGSLGKAAWNASRAASLVGRRGTQNAMQRSTLRRASRSVSSGVLGPGDPAPPSDVDGYLDYRGVASAQEAKALKNGEFSLGRYLHPKSGSGQRVGLEFEDLTRHAAIIGPSGSGKTKGVIVPWMATALRQGHCVVAVDIAGDLLDDLRIHVNSTGPCRANVGMWDYSRPTESLRWDWISNLNSDAEILAAVDAIHGKVRANDSQPFFHQRDARVLRGLLELVRLEGRPATGRDLLAVVRDQRRLDDLARRYAGSSGSRRVTDICHVPPDEYLRSVAGIINDLEVWDHPGLEAVTRGGTLDLDSLFDDANLLVIGAPIHGSRSSVSSSALLLSMIIQRLYQRFTQQSGRHVFLIVDEAARLVDRIDFEELLAVSRRARVSVVLATQDVGQFENDSERLAILGNCANYIHLPGPSKSNADYLAGRLGSRPSSTLTVSRNPTTDGRSGVGLSHQHNLIPVLGDRELMNPPWGERSAVVHTGRMAHPVLVDLTRDEFL